MISPKTSAYSLVGTRPRRSVSLEGLSGTLQPFDTGTLKVDQAIIGRVITGEGSAESASKITNSAVPHETEPFISYGGVSLTLAEQRRLDSIIQRFQKLPRLQRSILRLLFEHEGTAMTVPMMASWLSLKESTIRNHPPYDLIRPVFYKGANGKC
jgi:hypothetical protein